MAEDKHEVNTDETSASATTPPYEPPVARLPEILLTTPICVKAEWVTDAIHSHETVEEIAKGMIKQLVEVGGSKKLGLSLPHRSGAAPAFRVSASVKKQGTRGRTKPATLFPIGTKGGASVACILRTFWEALAYRNALVEVIDRARATGVLPAVPSKTEVVRQLWQTYRLPARGDKMVWSDKTEGGVEMKETSIASLRL
ncbi:unnamed protein product [Vitrella brassicaformis CCMP3155]|uniref:Uncharacterized protein n=1 Tax=Vitrella brassicaformis (strain CCMP3155) TaxID=1169540 RepID=A0A0G4ENS3_VITBC|nr:unnamed protein product [Vitrella brassicaformis CCMP3155]|eukprot:CEL98617.1 unnamed protein product [Vitrella brassicaformis CCMP3155]